jgi:hypothetical protein
MPTSPTIQGPCSVLGELLRTSHSNPSGNMPSTPLCVDKPASQWTRLAHSVSAVADRRYPGQSGEMLHPAELVLCAAFGTVEIGLPDDADEQERSDAVDRTLHQRPMLAHRPAHRPFHRWQDRLDRAHISSLSTSVRVIDEASRHEAAQLRRHAPAGVRTSATCGRITSTVHLPDSGTVSGAHDHLVHYPSRHDVLIWLLAPRY